MRRPSCRASFGDIVFTLRVVPALGATVALILSLAVSGCGERSQDTTRGSARVGGPSANTSVESAAELSKTNAEVQRLNKLAERHTHEISKLKAELAAARRNSQQLTAGALADQRGVGRAHIINRRGTVTLKDGTKRPFTTLSGGRLMPGPSGQQFTYERVPGELVLTVSNRGEVSVPVETIQTVSIAPETVDVGRLVNGCRVKVMPVDGKSYEFEVLYPFICYFHWAEPQIIEQFMNEKCLGMTLSFEQ
jgi:hypothetical protein